MSLRAGFHSMVASGELTLIANAYSAAHRNATSKWLWCAVTPSCTANQKTPRATGRCSTPVGTTKISPGLRVMVRSRKFDVERTLEHKKIVRVVMLMPAERPLKFGYHYVVVVVSRNCAWGETVGERRQLSPRFAGAFIAFPWLKGS